MEGNKELFYFHLTLSKLLKEVVLSQSSSVYRRWIHVIRRIRAKEENPVDILRQTGKDARGVEGSV